MRPVLQWLIIWYSIWILFNLGFRWRIDKFKNKFVFRGLFFLSGTIAVYLIYLINTRNYLGQLFLGFSIIYLVGKIFGNLKIYYSGFPKDRRFLEFQSFNVIFQQTITLSGIMLLQEYFGESFSHLHSGILYLCAHGLIIFAGWSTFRFFVLPLSFIGGAIFSYLALNFTYGVTINILLHQLVYVVWLYIVKDERKI